MRRDAVRALPLRFPLFLEWVAAFCRARRCSALSAAESGLVGTNSWSNSLVAAASSAVFISQWGFDVFFAMVPRKFSADVNGRRLPSPPVLLLLPVTQRASMDDIDDIFRIKNVNHLDVRSCSGWTADKVLSMPNLLRVRRPRAGDDKLSFPV